MSVMGRVGVVEDVRFREHRAPLGHPECPERLAAVAVAIAEREEQLVRVPPRPAADEEILRVHSAEHLETLAAAARAAPAQLDPDTYVARESLDVARLAAGAAVELAGQVARGELRAGLAAVRPPGHHAEAARAMGFCLLNNVAIAARALQHEHGLERILIVDWDVHHGNGTQHSFEEDPGVLYFSTHQFPYYPGTGDFGEAGRGRGAGATLNVPLPAGCGDGEYLGVLERVLVPVALAYRPQAILVSCGFDAHAADPLAGMRVTTAGFRAMASLVRSLADAVSGGRLVLVLEGGYAPDGLRQGTAAALDALLPSETPEVPAVAPPAPGSALDHVVGQVAHVHRDRFPELGSA